MARVGRRSPGTSIFRIARSVRGSASRTLAVNSRRSFSATVISCPPATTWLLVTITPSDRTMTPDPSEPSIRPRGAPPPNSWKNGSTVRTSRLEEMFTTAGATFFTTGAKDCFIESALAGTTRAGSASGGAGPADWA